MLFAGPRAYANMRAFAIELTIVEGEDEDDDDDDLDEADDEDEKAE